MSEHTMRDDNCWIYPRVRIPTLGSTRLCGGESQTGVAWLEADENADFEVSHDTFCRSGMRPRSPHFPGLTRGAAENCR